MKDIHSECHEVWENLGSWWDESVQDGDYFHRAFLYPTIEKWLNLRGNEQILDAGCGNGALSRRIANTGATVIGVDFSSSLLAQAKKRSPSIQYEQIDLTDFTALDALAKKMQFDRIVCSMVLHDMPTIIPFIKSLRSLLKPGGTFIFTIPHPCFNSPSVHFEPEGCVTMKDYQEAYTAKLRSKPDQPIEQHVFHRPIKEYMHVLIDQGMILSGFEEPCVDPKTLPENSIWGQRPNIPPALLCKWTCP